MNVLCVPSFIEQDSIARPERQLPEQQVSALFVCRAVRWCWIIVTVSVLNQLVLQCEVASLRLAVFIFTVHCVASFIAQDCGAGVIFICVFIKAAEGFRRRFECDRRVVPHNRAILLDWGGHANLEFCTCSRCLRYLYKYLFKGKKKVSLQLCVFRYWPEVSFHFLSSAGSRNSYTTFRAFWICDRKYTSGCKYAVTSS